MRRRHAPSARSPRMSIEVSARPQRYRVEKLAGLLTGFVRNAGAFDRRERAHSQRHDAKAANGQNGESDDRLE